MENFDFTTIALVVLDIALIGVGAVLIPTLQKVRTVLDTISGDVGRFGKLLAQIYETLADARVTNEQLRGEMRGISREVENLKQDISEIRRN